MSKHFLAAALIFSWVSLSSAEEAPRPESKTGNPPKVDSVSVEKMSMEELQKMEHSLVTQMNQADDAKGKKDAVEEKPAELAKKTEEAPKKDEAASKMSAAPIVKQASQPKPSHKAELDEANAKLKAAEAKIASLSQELEDSRNRLLIAETEVDRLSRVIEAKKNSDLSIGRSSSAAKAPQAPRGQDDTQIATVVADKAFLRSGPGKNNSPLMSVSQGTRLAVEIQQGGWYRVISPTGARAWVDGEVVVFGANPSDGPTQTVKVRGFGSSVDEAFDAIKRGVK